MSMFTKEEVINAMTVLLDEREKDIVSAAWGINTKALRPEQIFEQHNTNIDELRHLLKKVATYIRLHR